MIFFFYRTFSTLAAFPPQELESFTWDFEKPRRIHTKITQESNLFLGNLIVALVAKV